MDMTSKCLKHELSIFQKVSRVYNIIECPICFEQHDQPSRLECGKCGTSLSEQYTETLRGHVFCYKCLQNALKEQLSCPTCRRHASSRANMQILNTRNGLNEVIRSDSNETFTCDGFCLGSDCGRQHERKLKNLQIQS